MKRGRLRRAAAVLIGLTLLWIWGHSLVNADRSVAESGRVQALLAALFGPGIADTFLYRSIRKLAHFTEYALLGTECGVSRLLAADRRKGLRPVLLLGPAAAVIDELLQFFSPGRCPAAADVLLDSAGYFTGLAAALLIGWGICRLRARRRSRKRPENPKSV